MKNDLRFETLQLHAGQEPDPVTKSRAVPIYQTTSYVFDSMEHAENLFALKESGNIYTRIMNPTTDVFEKRMAALEGGVGAVATASGTSAIMYAILNVARAGDEIISAQTLYGGTYNMFAHVLPKFGIKVVFVNSDDPENFKKAITDKTKAIFAEAIGNPGINLIDIEAVAKIAHDNEIPMIMDSTFATPYLLRAFEHGVDIVAHSATKYIGGHGTSIGGVVIDSGNFDWAASSKFPDFNTPDVTYHGITYAKDLGKAAYIAKLRVQLLRDTGACISPFNSFLLLQGLETLSLRMERHIQNTVAVVNFLNSHANVSWVNYPTLAGNKYNALADQYFKKGTGSIFTFGIKGGYEAASKFIDKLEIFSHLANVADAKSLIIHPASTTHQQMNEQEQINAGISVDMLRVSVGIENVDDLIDDLTNALA